jgi:hypothetical protein
MTGNKAAGTYRNPAGQDECYCEGGARDQTCALWLKEKTKSREDAKSAKQDAKELQIVRPMFHSGIRQSDL